MKNIDVAILDKDRGYAEALGKSLAFRCPEFAVSVCPDKEILDTFDVLLSDKDTAASLSESCLNHTILLKEECDTISWRSMVEAGTGQLGKYQRVSNIIRAVKLFYAGKNQCSQLFFGEPVSTVVAGIFSGAGGTGCTAAAVAAARCLAQQTGKKVLFLTFDPIDSSENWFSFSKDQPSMEDFLYYFFEQANRQSQRLCLESFLHTDKSGVQTFCTTAPENQLCFLEQEELYELLQDIAAKGGIDYLVLDLGSHTDWRQRYLLRCCDVCALWGTQDIRCRIKNEKKILSLKQSYGLDTEGIIFITAAENKEEGEEPIGKAVEEFVAAIRQHVSERDVVY